MAYDFLNRLTKVGYPAYPTSLAKISYTKDSMLGSIAYGADEDRPQARDPVPVARPGLGPSHLRPGHGRHRLRRRHHRGDGGEHLRGRFFENWFTTAAWDTFLMFHDSFTALSVSAGNTISIQYTVQLGSTAYNNNLGILLAAILGTRSARPRCRSSLTPTSGTARPVQSTWSPLPVQRLPIGVTSRLRGPTSARAATGADSTIRVGTGSTSTLPRQQRGRLRAVAQRHQPLQPGPLSTSRSTATSSRPTWR